MASFSNTDTGDKPADPYKDKNIQEPKLKEKIDDLVAFMEHCKFGMMTTRIASSGMLTSRCMALAAKVCPVVLDVSQSCVHRREEKDADNCFNFQEGGGVDLLFHTNTESGKTDDLQSDPKINIAFLNPSGEWASISGEASIVTDRETVTKYYSSGLRAWLGDLGDGKHDGGPQDPRIGVIKVVAKTATYAIAEGTMLGRGGEIAKGVITGSAPKVHKLREISEQELEECKSPFSKFGSSLLHIKYSLLPRKSCERA